MCSGVSPFRCRFWAQSQKLEDGCGVQPARPGCFRQLRGQLAGGAARSCHCDCNCSCHSSSDDGALKLLEKQLDRCGPEHLCPQCPGCPTCPPPTPCPPLWPAGLGGFVAGVAATALVALCAGRCRGRQAGAPPARAAGPSPPLGIADAPAARLAAGALPAALDPRPPAGLLGPPALRGRASHRGAGVLTVG